MTDNMTEKLTALAIAVLFINCGLIIGVGAFVIFDTNNLFGDMHIIIGFAGLLALFYLMRFKKPKVEA